MTFHDEMVEKYGLPDWLPAGWVYKPAGKNKRPVYEMGINDVEFSCQPRINGRQIKHPAYSTWYHMLERCFDQSWKKKKPSYNDVTCCDEWLLFSNLLVWFNNNYINTYVLDKDLITRGNKIYSPTTSLFIPVAVNSFLLTRWLDRGDYPLDVFKKGNKYVASISYNNGKKHLGYFKSPEEAHQAWQSAKIKQAKVLKERYSIPEMQLVIDRLQNDLDNNLTTEVI